MSIPLFTIILPVYNVKDYLDRCIRSILVQKVSDWEMILVDDGSSDGSSDQCDQWSAQDPRIRVIHKENGGLSSARNAGLDAARGTYVLMFDSDDYVEANTLQVIRNAVMEQQSPDLIRFDMSIVRKGVITPKQTDVPAGLYDRSSIRQTLLRHGLLQPSGFSMSSCIHAYKLAFLNQHQLRFVSERIVLSEDFLFIICVLLCAERVYVTNAPLYFYDMREGSLTHSAKPRMFERYTTLCERAIAFASEKHTEEEIISWIKAYYVYTLVYSCCIHYGYSARSDHDLAKKRQNIRKLLRSPFLKKCVREMKTDHLSTKDKLRVLLIRWRLEPLLCYTFCHQKRKR